MNMISELKDDDILDFLMTSEFENDFKPEELKYFLVKWRYFYRLLHGKYTLSKDENIGLLRKQEDLTNKINSRINELEKENKAKDLVLNKLISRKLTFKERLKGKIIQ